MCNFFYQRHQEEKRALGRLTRRAETWEYERACYPGREVAVVLSDGAGDLDLMTMRWGYVAPWMKSIDTRRHMNNARSEGLLEPGRNVFKPSLKAQRCILPGTWFVEWTGQKGSKLKHHLARADGEGLLFAGLWTSNEQVQAEPLLSATMITTACNDWMSKYHDRQPVILEPDEALEWLNAPEPPLHLLTACNEELLTELDI